MKFPRVSFRSEFTFSMKVFHEKFVSFVSGRIDKRAYLQ